MDRFEGGLPPLSANLTALRAGHSSPPGTQATRSSNCCWGGRAAGGGGMFSLPPPHGATARGYAMPGYLSGERISKCMRVPLLGPPFFSFPRCFQVLGNRTRASSFPAKQVCHPKWHHPNASVFRIRKQYRFKKVRVTGRWRPTPGSSVIP